MEVDVLVPWKTFIFGQLKERNRQQNSFGSVIENYNQLWESREYFQSQCRKLEHDVNHLRSVNANLEKTAGASEELNQVNTKFKEANDELVQQLRENSELAREVLRLNRVMEELNEKYVKEETKARQLQIDIDQLRQKLEETESDLSHVKRTNQTIREESDALQSQLKKLQIDYNQLKPNNFALQQQLETAERLNKHLEAEVIHNKNRLAELHDLENERVNRVIKKENIPKSFEPSIFIDDDVVIISTEKIGNHQGNAMPHIPQESPSRLKRTNSQNSIGVSGGRLINNLIRKLTIGVNLESNDRTYRPTISCVSVAIPNQEVTHWDCTDSEVYALQFQPFGSILATGGSDKYLRLWEISSTGFQHKYCTLEGSSGSINAIDFDNEGNRLIAGCSGNKAYLWSYGEYRMLKETYTGHDGQIFTCKFLPGSKLATGSADRTIKVWDINQRQCTRSLLVGSKCLDICVMDATGTIISGHFDKKIRVWDPNNDQCRLVLEYDAPITSVAFNDARQQLLACFKNDLLRLIDLRQNRALYTFSNENFNVSTETTRAILSPDGQYACAGSHDGSIIIWNMEQKTCDRVLQRRHSTMVTGVAWHPEGRYLASCEKHRRVILWSE